MTKVIYFHGIHGNTAKTIAPWLEQEMSTRGIKVYHPVFFGDGEATFENFENIADKLLHEGAFDKDTIIIAHSIGNSFSIRYMAKHKLKPKAFISLAGFYEKFELKESIREQTYNALPNSQALDYLVDNVKIRISFYSNDHIVPQEVLKNFSHRIKSELIYLENKGHFGAKSGIQELPELIATMQRHDLM